MTDLRTSLSSEFMPEQALELIKEISSLHRAKGSMDYHRAIELIQTELTDTEYFSFPTNKTYGGWNCPPAFAVQDGYLRYADQGDYIVPRLKHFPIGAIFLAEATEGPVEFEVYNANQGESDEDYESYQPGQAVLASGKITKVYNEAVLKRDAPCIISSYMRKQDEKLGRTPEQMPTATNYLSFPSCYEKPALGFTITWREEQKLKSRLKDGPVTVEAKLEAGETTGQLEVLSARAGTNKNGQKPLLLTAHLCHPRPGANDNASGAALLVEIMRTLQATELPREVYALWIPEMFGTVALLESGWFDKDFELAINLDMVGGDQAKIDSALNIFSTPWSVPSFISELMTEKLATDAFRWKQSSYAGGTDHYILANPSAGIPAISLTQQPDRFYHTDQDTAANCSTETLTWVGQAVLATLAELMEPDDQTIAATAGRIMANYFKEKARLEEPLVKDYFTYLTWQKLKALSEYGSVEPGLNWLNLGTPRIELPDFRFDFRQIAGPIATSHLDTPGLINLDNLREKYNNWGVFQDELVNFIELGFSEEEALQLARAEFDLPEDIAEPARKFLQEAAAHNLIKRPAQGRQKG